RVAEGILQARYRKELSVRSLDTLRYRDNALVIPLQCFLDLGQEPLLIERDLGQQKHVRGIALMVSSQRTSGGRPASMSAHHFHSEHFGRGAAHRGQIECRLAQRGRNIFRYRDKAWRTVRARY